MYDELIKRLRAAKAVVFKNEDVTLLGEAADAIEELSAIREEQKAQIILMGAEIEELKTYSELYQSLTDKSQKTARNLLDAYPKWIPVTERLPKEGEFVLVHGNLYPNKHDGGVIAVSKRMDWNYWQGFGRERDITHWMPLPEPPKEE